MALIEHKIEHLEKELKHVEMLITSVQVEQQSVAPYVFQSIQLTRELEEHLKIVKEYLRKERAFRWLLTWLNFVSFSTIIIIVSILLTGRK